MTAKAEILDLMNQLPDNLTVDETIRRLRSAYFARYGARNEPKGHIKEDDFKKTQPESVPLPLDGRRIKERIIEIAEGLPDDLTSAETICKAADDLRLFFLIQRDMEDIREGRIPPFDEQDDMPVFEGEVPELGAISADAFAKMTIKEKLIHTMSRLPDDLTLGRAVVEALERMLLMYKLEKSFEQIQRGETYTTEEVRQRMQEWRK